MKTNTSYRLAVAGLAVLALFASVSCGKKSGGGVATAPATTQDCTGSKCNVGQQYASGVYLTTAYGEAQHGYNKNVSAKIAFYGKESSGLDKDSFKEAIVSYQGKVVANGNLKVNNGQYAGISKLQADRMVSALTFTFDAGFWLGGGAGYNNSYNNNYSYPNYDYGYDYSYPDYDYDYGNNSCNSCGPCNNYCNDGGNNSSSCELPAGDYKITTLTSGDWDSGYYSASFSNLKLKLTISGTTAEAVFTQGYVQAYGNNSSQNQLGGQLVIKKINSKTCNKAINFY